MRPSGELSGGEMSRLQVALLILSGSNFLLLDEPTNNLDMDSVEALEDALIEFGGTLMVISHDRYFLDKVCTRTLALDGGIMLDYPGGYSWVQENLALGSPLTWALRERQSPAREGRLSGQR
jgi:ATP-binding cassette subfamily F protein 3